MQVVCFLVACSRFTAHCIHLRQHSDDEYVWVQKLQPRMFRSDGTTHTAVKIEGTELDECPEWFSYLPAPPLPMEEPLVAVAHAVRPPNPFEFAK
jgi:hypothetical protein